MMYTRKGIKVTDGIIKNGNKYGYMVDCCCNRCGGAGWGPWFQDGGICYACRGSGGHHKKFVQLYTEDQLAKLNERSEQRRIQKEAEREAIRGAIREQALEHYNQIIQRAEPFAAENSFIRNMLDTLHSGKYTRLSAKQEIALHKAVETQEALKQQEDVPIGDAPKGKQTVSGIILSVKNIENRFGIQTKMLVRLDNQATVYGTAGKALFEQVSCTAESEDFFNDQDYNGAYNASYRVRFVGVRIKFDADFEPSNDKNHAFFKRPTKLSVLPATGATPCEQ